jgi:ComF family protein
VAAAQLTECGDCAGRERYFRVARAAGLYEGELHRLIHRFKFRRERRLAAPLAGLLAETWRRSPELSQAAVLVPVPLAPERLAGRGFNQSEELAHALGGLVRRPICPEALLRVPGGPAQSRCSEAGRSGVRERFRTFRPQPVCGRRVTLVDDVLTTGATAEACALALLKAGARSVDVVTVATTVVADRWLDSPAGQEMGSSR